MKRATQVEANYRHGDPMTNCGTCSYYQGAITKRCTQVMGDISPYGVSDIFKAAPNPFGSMLSDQEKATIKTMAAGRQQAGVPQQQPNPAAISAVAAGG